MQCMMNYFCKVVTIDNGSGNLRYLIFHDVVQTFVEAKDRVLGILEQECTGYTMKGQIFHCI